MRWDDMRGLGDESSLEWQILELKRELADFRRKSRESQNEEKPRTEWDIRSDLRQARRELEKRKEREEREYQWQQQRQIAEEIQSLRKRPEFPLEQIEQSKPDVEDIRSRSSKSGGVTINWQGVFFVLVMILAWFWFNRPVEPRFESQSDRIQTTQTVR